MRPTEYLKAMPAILKKIKNNLQSKTAMLGFHLVAAPFAFLLACGMAQAAQPVLVPVPREYQGRQDISLTHGIAVSAPGGYKDDKFAARDLADDLKQRGVVVSSAAATRIYLLRDTSVAGKNALSRAKAAMDQAMGDEGYVLFTSGRNIYVVGHSASGVFYGAQTAKQLVSGQGRDAIFEGCRIRDWPAMKYRGTQDDLSRGPVPTLDFQKKQIRTFAAYKLNIYSPYYEHTFQYASNPVPGLPGGSITRAEAAELVAYAKQYHITIVPEQEAFGHLHHVLKFQQYAQLSEIPHGDVLAPGEPGSLPLIKQWFTELSEIYPGPFLHIGADETFQLGQGKTSADVKQRNLGPVYMDFLKSIHDELEPLHRRLLFWGDIAMKDPGEVHRLPKDMIAVAWVYDPHDEGFSKWLDPYIKAGLETWVAPGVNNWSRVYPNNNYALKNIQRFVADGQKAGSTGMLNTVWNDDGEGLFLQDWYGVLFGAAAAWQPGTSDIERFQHSYGQVFHGDTTGKIDEAQIALMRVHQLISDAHVGDARDRVFWMDPWTESGQQTTQALGPVLEEIRNQAERAIAWIAQAKQAGNLREPDALEAMELGARRMDFLALRLQTAGAIPAVYLGIYKNPDGTNRQSLGEVSRSGACEDIVTGLGYLADLYKDVWLKENRPYYLNNILLRYEIAQELWAKRESEMRSLGGDWTRTHTLPTPESLGIALTEGN